MNRLREELAWLRQNPIEATHWWFRRLVIQRLNGERKAAREYERRMRWDPWEKAEFHCPYDGTPLTAPWEKCSICGRND